MSLLAIELYYLHTVDWCFGRVCLPQSILPFVTHVRAVSLINGFNASIVLQPLRTEVFTNLPIRGNAGRYLSLKKLCPPDRTLWNVNYNTYIVLLFRRKSRWIASSSITLGSNYSYLRECKAPKSSWAPENVLKNPDHTGTQSHNGHKRQTSIAAQELRARKHKGCIEIYTHGECLYCSLIPSPATDTHPIGHADRQHYRGLA